MTTHARQLGLLVVLASAAMAVGLDVGRREARAAGAEIAPPHDCACGMQCVGNCCCTARTRPDVETPPSPAQEADAVSEILCVRACSCGPAPGAPAMPRLESFSVSHDALASMSPFILVSLRPRLSGGATSITPAMPDAPPTQPPEA